MEFSPPDGTAQILISPHAGTWRALCSHKKFHLSLGSPSAARAARPPQPPHLTNPRSADSLPIYQACIFNVTEASKQVPTIDR